MCNHQKVYTYTSSTSEVSEHECRASQGLSWQYAKKKVLIITNKEIYNNWQAEQIQHLLGYHLQINMSGFILTWQILHKTCGQLITVDRRQFLGQHSPGGTFPNVPKDWLCKEGNMHTAMTAEAHQDTVTGQERHRTTDVQWEQIHTKLLSHT